MSAFKIEYLLAFLSPSLAVEGFNKDIRFFSDFESDSDDDDDDDSDDDDDDSDDDDDDDDDDDES